MVYNCSIIDLHDRFIVGYANGTRIDNLLAIEALENALKNEKNHSNLILEWQGFLVQKIFVHN